MLGYAFMGKAPVNGYKKISYMTWPPPLQPCDRRQAHDGLQLPLRAV